VNFDFKLEHSYIPQKSGGGGGGVVTFTKRKIYEGSFLTNYDEVGDAKSYTPILKECRA